MLCRFVSVAVALFLSVVPVFGQGFATPEFNGSVVDPSGGALPGVTITVTEETTGLVQTVISNDVGRFVLPAMPPGRYTIRTELSGFQSQVTDVGRDNRDTGGACAETGTIQPRNDVTGGSGAPRGPSAPEAAVAGRPPDDRRPLRGL
jgi:Carboxypeptidase regulatory-like domain